METIGTEKKEIERHRKYVELSAKAWDTMDLGALKELMVLNSGYEKSSWCGTDPNKTPTSPLPLAARKGWFEAVSMLSAAGVDPSTPDGDIQGLSGNGMTPLAQALARGDYPMCEALWSLGAKAAPSSDMARSVGQASSWRGPSAGYSALEWLIGKGWSPWAAGGESEGVQASIFLFLSSTKKQTPEQKHALDEAWFKGADWTDPFVSSCGWHYVFGACSSGAACSKQVIKSFFVSSKDPSDQARKTLGWALEGRSRDGAQAAASALEWEFGWRELGGLELEKSCKKAVSMGREELASKGVENAKEQYEAFCSWWEIAGPKAQMYSKFIDRCAFEAMKSGQWGLAEGLLFEAGADPHWIAQAWSGPDGPGSTAMTFYLPLYAPSRAMCMAKVAMGRKSGGEDALILAKKIFESMSCYVERSSTGAFAAAFEQAQVVASRRFAKELDQDLTNKGGSLTKPVRI